MNVDREEGVGVRRRDDELHASVPVAIVDELNVPLHDAARASKRKSPSHELTTGGSRQGGHGIVMTTCCKSMVSAASYSMLTDVSLPLMDGQQLILRGKLDSSFVEKRHFNTPRADPHGNGRFGSFKPKIFSFACNPLSMFGCVLNWNPLFSPALVMTRMSASSSLRTSSIMLPCTSICSNPPLRSKETLSFSSMTRSTLSAESRSAPGRRRGVARRLDDIHVRNLAFRA